MTKSEPPTYDAAERVLLDILCWQGEIHAVYNDEYFKAADVRDAIAAALSFMRCRQQGNAPSGAFSRYVSKVSMRRGGNKEDAK